MSVRVVEGVRNATEGVVGRAGATGPAQRRPTLFLNDIRARAYQLWEAAGRPPGDCTRYWLQAERQLLEAC